MPKKAKAQRTAPTRVHQHVAPLDPWSLVHLVTGVLLAWVMQPLVALAIMTLWEPLETLILSPLLWRAGIVFGDESLKNSLTDMVCNGVGVALGYWLLTRHFTPPFHLF